MVLLHQLKQVKARVLPQFSRNVQPAWVGRMLLPDQLQETWAQLQLQLSSGMHLELAQGLRDSRMRSQVGG